MQEIGRPVGYLGWTSDSRNQLEKRNLPGAHPSSIKRTGTRNQVVIKGKRCGTGGPRFRMWRILKHHGSVVHSVGGKAYKLASLVSSFGVSK